MLLIPYRRVVLLSDRPVGDLLNRLSARTGRMRWFWLAEANKAFSGSIRGPRFQVVANQSGRNTYVAWIRGHVEPSSTGSQVRAMITLHPIAVFILGALLVWLLAEGAVPAVSIVFGAVLFHIVMCVVGFWPSVRQAETELRKLAE